MKEDKIMEIDTQVGAHKGLHAALADTLRERNRLNRGEKVDMIKIRSKELPLLTNQSS